MVNFKLVELEKVCTILNGDRGINYPSGSDFVEFGVPFINAGHISEGLIDKTNMDYISEEHYQRIGGAKLQKDDIVLCLRGSLGKYALIFEDRGAPASSLAVLRCSKEKLDYRYLFQLLGSSVISNQIEKDNSGSSQPNLSALSVKKFQIPLPEKDEQVAIAEALSDADSLIMALEKLIAKKNAIKQGAMQELLTGKKRLLGFNGEWVEKDLGHLFVFSGGVSASREQLSDTGHFYLHYGDIHSCSKNYIDTITDTLLIPKLDIELSKVPLTARLEDGDVVFVDASEDDEGASKHIIVRNSSKKTFIAGLHTIVAKSIGNEIVNVYREYCFRTKDIKTQFKYYCAGTKVTGISKANIAKIVLKYPADKKEQTAIADILSDMDAEIDQLEKKLAKYRLVKQGMMQELLSGRIRLI